MEAQFKGNFHLSRAEHTVISTTGTLTKDGKTYTFDPFGTEYVVPRLKLCKHYGSLIDSNKTYIFSALSTKETALTINDFKQNIEMSYGVGYAYAPDEILITEVYYSSGDDVFTLCTISGEETQIAGNELTLGNDSVKVIY